MTMPFWTKAALLLRPGGSCCFCKPFSDSLVLSRDGTHPCLPGHVGEGGLCGEHGCSMGKVPSLLRSAVFKWIIVLEKI